MMKQQTKTCFCWCHNLLLLQQDPFDQYFHQCLYILFMTLGILYQIMCFHYTVPCNVKLIDLFAMVTRHRHIICQNILEMLCYKLVISQSVTKLPPTYVPISKMWQNLLGHQKQPKRGVFGVVFSKFLNNDAFNYRKCYLCFKTTQRQ